MEASRELLHLLVMAAAPCLGRHASGVGDSLWFVVRCWGGAREFVRVFVAPCRASVTTDIPAKALNSHGCGLLFLAMVHIDLYTCLGCAAAHNLQQVYPVWAGMVHVVLARAGALDSRSYKWLCPVMLHVGWPVCLWCAAAHNVCLPSTNNYFCNCVCPLPDGQK